MSTNIQTHPLPSGLGYLDPTQLPQFLSLAEGIVTLPVSSDTAVVYADGKGIATIGYGLNLLVPQYLALVLNELGVFAASDAQQAASGVTETAAQQAARYQAIVANFEGVIQSHKIAAGNPQGTSSSEVSLQDDLTQDLNTYLGTTGRTFTLTKAQSADLRNEVITGFAIGPYVDAGKQSRLDAILSRNGLAIGHDTREYMALMSLFYNGEGLLSASGPLMTALKSGDRAEVWFVIRYGLNKRWNTDIHSGGVAARRFAEAQLFGLYSPYAAGTGPSLDDAVAAYRMLQTHRSEMLQYEAYWGAPPNGNAVLVHDELDPANTTYSGFLTSQGANVAHERQGWREQSPQWMCSWASPASAYVFRA